MALTSFSNSAIRFLRPVFFGTPDRIIATIAFVFLIILRGMAIPADADWSLMLGFQRGVNGPDLASCMIFSILSFFVFMFNIWSLSIIYVRTRSTPNDSAGGAIFQFARPFTDIRPELRPVILLAAGIGLSALLDLFGHPVMEIYQGISIQGNIGWQTTEWPAVLAKLSIIAIAGWAQILAIIRQFIIFLIIGSWISMFTASSQMQVFCREWLDFLLGPIRRYPIRIGMIDLSPIVFFFIVGFIHSLLLAILINSFNKLP